MYILSLKYSKRNQQGFVSIVVTMILLIVLTLIVIGFSALARREQQASLDRQLSTQAFYAAESGINDTVGAFQNKTLTLGSRTKCDPTAPPALPANMQVAIDANHNVKYTCVLYDTSPSYLSYAPPTDTTRTYQIDNTDLTSLSFNWKGSQALPTYRPSLGSQFTPPNVWNSQTGVIQVKLIPRGSGTTTLDGYIQNTFTAFLYPNSDGSPVSYSTVPFGSSTGGLNENNPAVIVSGDCNNTKTAPLQSGCNVTVNGLQPSTTGWYIVVHAYYSSPNLQIRGTNGGGNVSLQGAQAIIDVTGQANDVLRRVEVRKSLGVNCDAICPEGFISIGDICKQVTLQPGIAPEIDDSAPGGCSFNPIPPPNF